MGKPVIKWAVFFSFFCLFLFCFHRQKMGKMRNPPPMDWNDITCCAIGKKIDITMTTWMNWGRRWQAFPEFRSAINLVFILGFCTVHLRKDSAITRVARVIYHSFHFVFLSGRMRCVSRPLQTDPTLLANNTQHCWDQQCCDLLRPFSWNHNNVGTCWHFLRTVWNRSNFWPNRSQHFDCSATGKA